MKISALKCAVIGSNPVVRIVTDEGIDGYGQIEATKPYLKPHPPPVHHAELPGHAATELRE